MLRRPSHSDEIRRQLGRRFMEEGLAMWRCRQQELLFNKANEQAQLRDMLSAYSPWGRPGGGAPNADTLRKRHALRLDALHNRNTSSSPLPGGLPKSTASTPSNTWRRHAPKWRRDPLMWFQPTESAPAHVLNNEQRYVPTEQEQEVYKKQLDAIVQEKKRAKDDEYRKQVTVEQQLGWTDENTLRDLLKATSPPSASPGTSPNSPGAELPETAPAEESHEQHLQLAQLPRSANSGKSTGTTTSSRQPGPGAGAGPGPGRGGVELVPLLAKRRNAPRFFLGTTDVTKPHEPQDGRDLPIEAHRDYWRALQQQIDRKRLKLEASRAEELESSKRHFETWQLLWGRPGHGAPRPVKVKEKLDVLLYQLPQLQLAAR